MLVKFSNTVTQFVNIDRQIKYNFQTKHLINITILGLQSNGYNRTIVNKLLHKTNNRQRQKTTN